MLRKVARLPSLQPGAAERAKQLGLALPAAVFSPRYRMAQTEPRIAGLQSAFFARQDCSRVGERIVDAASGVRPAGLTLDELANKLIKDMYFKFRFLCGEAPQLVWILDVFTHENSALRGEPDFFAALSATVERCLAEMTRWGLAVSPQNVLFTHSPRFITYTYQLLGQLFAQKRVYLREEFLLHALNSESPAPVAEQLRVEEKTRGAVVCLRFEGGHGDELEFLNANEVFLLVAVTEPLQAVLGQFVCVQAAAVFLVFEFEKRTFVAAESFVTAEPLFRKSARPKLLGRLVGSQLGGAGVSAVAGGRWAVLAGQGRIGGTGAEVVAPELGPSQLEITQAIGVRWLSSFSGPVLAEGPFAGLSPDEAAFEAAKVLQRLELSKIDYVVEPERWVLRGSNERLFMRTQTDFFMRISLTEREAIIKALGRTHTIGPTQSVEEASLEDVLRAEGDVRLSAIGAFGLPFPVLRISNSVDVVHTSEVVANFQREFSAARLEDWDKVPTAALHQGVVGKFERLDLVIADDFLRCIAFLLDEECSLTVIESLAQNTDLLWKALAVQYVLHGSIVLDRLKRHHLIQPAGEGSLRARTLVEGSQHATGRFYGSGADAFRLYLAATDLLATRRSTLVLTPAQMNTKVSEINFIREVFWRIFRLVRPDTERLDPESFQSQTDRLSRGVWALFKFLSEKVQKAYAEGDFHSVYTNSMDFLKNYIADLYLPVVRDAFVDDPHSKLTIVGTNTLRTMAEELLGLLAPILPFNCEDIYQQAVCGKDSVFATRLVRHVFPATPSVALDIAFVEMVKDVERYLAAARASHLQSPRREGAAFALALEPCRLVDESLFQHLTNSEEETLRAAWNVAELRLSAGETWPVVDPSREKSLPVHKCIASLGGRKLELQIRLTHLKGTRPCQRCEKHFRPTDEKLFCAPCCERLRLLRDFGSQAVMA